jgi:hypothetical protein
MDLRPSNLTLWLCTVLAAGAVLPTLAQPSQQSIIFSKPAEDVADKANSFMSQQPHKGPSGLNAPGGLFGVGKSRTDYDLLPGAQPPMPISPEQTKAWQNFLDGKKNWTLLTPEEILGIPTAEKILGIPEAEEDKNLTVEERYIKRQDHNRLVSATNALRRADALSRGDQNPFEPSRNGTRTPIARNEGSLLDPKRYLGQLLNTTPEERAAVELSRRPDSPWASAFALPAQLPKPSVEQVAAMERFKVLMDPSLAEKPVAPTRSPQVATVNPHMQVQPDFNPLGQSFKPLRSELNKPMGLTPLSGITGTRKVLTPKKSEADPQLPPWLSDKPLPVGMQQRKF